jgi:ribose 1,5-bisphosphokinase
MTWLIDLRTAASACPGTIGPGRLVLVVGPSGAGKDTLIEGARQECRGDPNIVFPQRVVTRPPSDAESNELLAEPDFARAVAEGAFALWWDAHGHRYGIPICIDEDIRRGRTIVCNVSRTIIGTTRRRYAHVSVVLVTAPADVLQARLEARRRPSDGNVAARIQRSATIEPCSDADFVINNVGRPAVGVRRLVNAIRDPGIVVIW